MAVVRIIQGPDFGRRITLKKGANVFGRLTSCDAQLTDPLISRRHIQIAWIPDLEVWIVTALKSSNGTHVNGVALALASDVQLQTGDQISLAASTILEFDAATPGSGNDPRRRVKNPKLGKEPTK